MSKPQTVLAVDDSPDVHDLLDVRLKGEGYQIVHALDGATGIALARELRPDLMLLDVDMPDMSGFEVCRTLKAHADTEPVPVVFLTATSETFVKVEAFDLGAVDYVTKPFDVAELRARVRAALRTKLYLDLLAMRAEIDGLTGLFNRAHFDRKLRQMLDRASLVGASVSVAMIDIDHFKKVNDRHGHPFGDRVLAMVGEALVGNSRSGDLACRYGGEEFAVIMEGTDAAGARIAADRLGRKLAGLSCEHKGETVHVTASVGIASTDLFMDLDDVTPVQLVSAADNALYEAKAGGRNRVCVAARRKTSLSAEQPDIAASLREAATA